MSMAMGEFPTVSGSAAAAPFGSSATTPPKRPVEIPFRRLECLVGANASPSRVARALAVRLVSQGASERHFSNACRSNSIPLGSLKAHLESLADSAPFLHRIWLDARRFTDPLSQESYRSRLELHRLVVALRPATDETLRWVHLAMLGSALTDALPGGFRYPAEELWADTGLALSTVKRLRKLLVDGNEFRLVDFDPSGFVPNRYRTVISPLLASQHRLPPSLRSGGRLVESAGTDLEASLSSEPSGSVGADVVPSRLSALLTLGAHPGFWPGALGPIAHHVLCILLASPHSLTAKALAERTGRSDEAVASALRNLREAGLSTTPNSRANAATDEPIEPLLDAVAERTDSASNRAERLAYRVESIAARKAERAQRSGSSKRTHDVARRIVEAFGTDPGWAQLAEVGTEIGDSEVAESLLVLGRWAAGQVGGEPLAEEALMKAIDEAARGWWKGAPGDALDALLDEVWERMDSSAALVNR